MESMINLDGASAAASRPRSAISIPYMLAEAKKNPKVQFRHCGGLWTGQGPEERRLLFRLHRAGAVSQRHRRRACDQVEEDRLRRGQADPAGAEQHQRLPARRPERRSVDHLPGHLHRRVVARGQGGGGDQRADRPGRRRHHLPRRQPEGGGRDRRAGRGAFVCGYHADQSPLAPQKYLTGAEWNWATDLQGLRRRRCRPARSPPNFVRGGLADGFVKMSPYGPGVSEAARKNADAVKAEMMKGGFAIIKGPLKDNNGKEIVAAGQGVSRRRRPSWRARTTSSRA